MTIRRVGPEDRELFRAIRLRSLRDTPTAFGSTYEREAAFTDDIWDGRLSQDGNAHFVAEAPDDTPNGIVGAVRDEEEAHVAHVVGMWVDPPARGSGVADGLVAEVTRWAEREGVAALRLHVTEGNVRAERVYERHGFRRTGQTFVRERDGLAEIEMERGVRGSD